ncbi:MAG: NADH-quinone oxidoreductase subunit C [Chloroflexi bacterium]|nr:NADH-quinone oxidoreductase subunit C [Chloroflexota bacterium]
MERDQLLINKITQVYAEAIEEVIEFRGEKTIYITKSALKNVCQLLRDDADLQYNFLTDICADDMLPDFPRFAINYQLNSLPYNHRIRLRVLVEDPEDGPETIGTIWPIATWLEMEVWDLMGIRFKGNGSLRRLFLPEDWQGHPLRKDYPLGYEEVQFSFNFDEIDAKKPYATRD